MATSSPFSILDTLFDKVSSFVKPPPAVVRELHQRLVLLLNHVLMQEPEAMARLVRQKDKAVRIQWRDFSIDLCATPAGLLDLTSPDVRPDLVLTVTDASPLTLLEKSLGGDKPSIHVDGDVQLGAELNWLIDHVRWDMEEDLARVMGDVAAHRLASVGREMAKAIKLFAQTGLKRKSAA